MDKKPDGGAAFPLTSSRPDFTGMTLRDYFAAKAMAAMIGSPQNLHAADLAAQKKGQAGTPFIAEAAYDFADAMIAARTAR